jgi:hypothetical protein
MAHRRTADRWPRPFLDPAAGYRERYGAAPHGSLVASGQTKEREMRRMLAVAVTAAAFSFVVPGLAQAEPTFSGTTTTPEGKLSLVLKVDRFRATAAGTQATGTATATLTPIGQSPTTVTKKVTLAASRSGSCTILTLTLETLELQLLGLNVHLEKVVLTVTGQRHGGVLGSLFCSLANARVKAARAAAVARLNAGIRRTGVVQPLALSTTIRATTAATGPTCPVLNLILGPLHLNLLGLVVDLNQVHLTITAEPTGGVLGSLFCGLANTKL